MEAEAGRALLRECEKLGISPVGESYWRVPCRQCQRKRTFEEATFYKMRLLGLLFCKSCLERMKLAAVTVGPTAGEVITS